MEPFKHLLNEKAVRQLAAELARAYNGFDTRAFVRESLDGLEALELTPRAWHIAEAMQRHLPQPFARAGDALLRSFGPEAPSSGEGGVSNMRYLPHVYFVQKYGLVDFEAAMRVQYELTKRFTAEWSIRAFIEAYPEQTMARLRAWTGDENQHVRRLVSEGTRPRLPWASRLRAFQQDPAPVLALLELLKDDAERYVQRSVANNLGDIAKDHPDLAVEVCRRWLPGREWIVRHALRLLVKQGHAGALSILGAGAKPPVRIENARVTPAKVALGGAVRFSFALVSAAKAAQDLLVDYAVYYAKANGEAKLKVFKLRRIALAAGGSVELEGRVSLKDLTTRKHYPGRHRIEARINGVAFPLADFTVTAALR